MANLEIAVAARRDQCVQCDRRESRFELVRRSHNVGHKQCRNSQSCRSPNRGWVSFKIGQRSQ